MIFNRFYCKDSYDMCNMCKINATDCIGDGNLEKCRKANLNGKLFHAKYHYSFIIPIIPLC